MVLLFYHFVTEANLCCTMCPVARTRAHRLFQNMSTLLLFVSKPLCPKGTTATHCCSTTCVQHLGMPLLHPQLGRRAVQRRLLPRQDRLPRTVSRNGCRVYVSTPLSFDHGFFSPSRKTVNAQTHIMQFLCYVPSSLSLGGTSSVVLGFMHRCPRIMSELQPFSIYACACVLRLCDISLRAHSFFIVLASPFPTLIYEPANNPNSQTLQTHSPQTHPVAKDTPSNLPLS